MKYQKAKQHLIELLVNHFEVLAQTEKSMKNFKENDNYSINNFLIYFKDCCEIEIEIYKILKCFSKIKVVYEIENDEIKLKALTEFLNKKIEPKLTIDLEKDLAAELDKDEKSK